MNFQDFLTAYINNENRASAYSSYSLGPIRKAAEIIGNPHLTYNTALITGTNGKGTTAAYLHALVREAGYSCGLYTSPHLVTVHERIRIDEMIPDDEAVSIGKWIAVQCPNISLTYFDMLTLIAFEYFRRHNVSWAVLETGLGGKLDSTTIARPKVSIITGISLDHTGILGDTIEAISEDKSHVIRDATPAVSLSQQPHVKQIIENRAEKTGAPVYHYPADFDILEETPGETYTYQDKQNTVGHIPIAHSDKWRPVNAAAALRAFFAAGLFLDEDTIRSAFASVTVPGRFEKLNDDPILYYDTAHNEASAASLIETVTKKFPQNDVTFFVCFMRDKKPEKLMKMFIAAGRRVVYCSVPDERAYLPENAPVPVVSIQDPHSVSSMITPESVSVFCGTFRMYTYMGDIIKSIHVTSQL